MKKILLIEDQKKCFDYYRELIEKENFFTIINDGPVFDSSDVAYRTREEQESIIKELIEKTDYDIVLCDLNLRKEEENYSVGMMNRCLSICIYFDKKHDLEAAGKFFVFVTRRTEWDENEIYKIPGIQQEDKLIKCGRKHVKYPYCPHIDSQGNPLCGEQFNNCGSSICFNKRLRRMTDG